MDILDISEKYTEDESILSYETFTYYPITGTQINSSGPIVIQVNNSDNFFHPSESYLEFEGCLKNGAGHFADTALITFVNNAMMYLFDNIRYELNNTEIESVFYPGQATTLFGLAMYSTNFNNGCGLNMSWSLDTNELADDTNLGFKKRREFILVSKPAPLGSFRFCVPLKHLFGFADDYNKILYGFSQTLTLVRSSSDNNCLFRKTDDPDISPNADVPDGTVYLTNISWKLPRVIPSDMKKYDLLKQIKAEVTLNVAFRMRQTITTSVPPSTKFTWRVGVR